MKKLSVLLLIYFSIEIFSQAQEINPEKLQNNVNSATFVFEARQASGLRGRMIQIDPGYMLHVTKDQVKGNLPFFGRAYQSTPGAEGGLSFDFSEFSYEIKSRKKGGWDVTIEPTESNDIRVIYLTIQKSGNASLRIISDSKSGMNYIGNLQK